MKQLMLEKDQKIQMLKKQKELYKSAKDVTQAFGMRPEVELDP